MGMMYDVCDRGTHAPLLLTHLHMGLHGLPLPPKVCCEAGGRLHLIWHTCT